MTLSATWQYPYLITINKIVTPFRNKYLAALFCFTIIIGPAYLSAQKTTGLFRALKAAETGIYFRNDITENDATNDSNHVAYGGGGVAVGDLNNDGLPDIVFISNQNGPALYMNKGHLKFKNETEKAGLSGYIGNFNGVNIIDVNGDGWNDIFICQSEGNRRKLLFINNHDGTFIEQAAAYGINDIGVTNQSLFFDFNNDGYLDLLLLNTLPPSNAPCTKPKEVHESKYGFDVRDYLTNTQYNCWGPRFLVNKNNHFEDITDSVGLQHRFSISNSAVVCDVNFDGYPDVLICNDFITPDFLYQNDSAKRFTNVASDYFKHTSMFSMGSDYADINNDGIPDIFVGDMLPSSHSRDKNSMIPFSYEFYHLFHSKIQPPEYITNCLFLGSLSPPFNEIANEAGVARTDWTWSPIIQDFDNDGRNDIFVTQGIKRNVADLDYINVMSDNDNPAYSLTPNTYFKSLPTYSLHNFMFHNTGNLSFDDVSRDWGFGDTIKSCGAAYADLDGDGDLDLVVNNTDGVATVYENLSDVINHNHFIRFKLAGNNHNTAGIGAFVKISFNGGQGVEYIGNNHGFFSTTEPIAHFGLGKVTRIDSVECFWPGGDYQVFKNLKADSLYIIHQQSGIKKIYHPVVKQENLLKEVFPNTKSIEHHENYYVDFKHYRLQPFKLSAEGPGTAVGDVNNDGLQDFYLGAAKGSVGQLWLQKKDGSFELSKNQPWSKDSTLENQGCVIADFNHDGFNDLLIANGSGENLKGDKGNVLKLYLNDGHGNFIDASDRIPQKDICYSAVSVCDFNGDGYLDILAAGRLTPEEYPLPASTRLLVNHQGRFTDETDSLAPELNNIGNVRSAIWSDFDNDGKPDIVLAGEWMPVTFLHNDNGKFTKISCGGAVDSAFGLWTNIIQADFEHDGKMDYVVCNYGTNSYLKATHEEPVLLFYDDFDDNGVYEPLVFHYLHDSIGILYDRNTYCEQMPRNWAKFLTYKSFADAKMSDFISPEKMVTSKKFKVNEMRTSYIKNLGGGKFEMTPLPVECQLSAMYGALPIDVNGDGNTDIVMVGNADVNLTQYTPMDATKGVVLINDGKGNFKALNPEESGFKNTGYGRGVYVINGPGDQPLLLVANNNSAMKFYKLVKTPDHR